METKKRFWVSWWSGYYEDEGCTQPPFQLWISGERSRADDLTEISIVSVIDAESEEQIWGAVKKHFPDMQPRFCEQTAPDYKPGKRFPGFENRTSLFE